MKSYKINQYLFIQISKYFLLILFIFLSISWLLQITRLFTITNFMQLDMLAILLLSLYLIPNIITVILPFIIIFGLLLCFIKLNKDNELISILSLGLGLNPFKKTLFLFTLIIILFFSVLNLYLAPKIYKQYKIQEHELRNTLDLNNMNFSNFLNLNKSTVLDFKKVNNMYQDIFISFNDNKENFVYAKKGKIINDNNLFKFQLTDGFKISFDNKNQIEKLEFLNYILKIENKNIKDNTVVDKNTFTLFDDIKTKNYTNIIFKIFDIILICFIVFLFYHNNLKKVNFDSKNNIYYSLLCISILIINQVLKNTEIYFLNYIVFVFSIIFISLIVSNIKKKYE